MRLNQVLHLSAGKRDAQWQVGDERILAWCGRLDRRDLEREVGHVCQLIDPSLRAPVEALSPQIKDDHVRRNPAHATVLDDRLNRRCPFFSLLRNEKDIRARDWHRRSILILESKNNLGMRVVLVTRVVEEVEET